MLNSSFSSPRILKRDNRLLKLINCEVLRHYINWEGGERTDRKTLSQSVGREMMQALVELRDANP